MSDNRSRRPWDDDEDPADDGSSFEEAFGGHLPDEDDDETMLLVFRVTNPQGSVGVTVQLDGSIAHVDLSPAVTRMTESQLADEIQVLADLAREQARAGQLALLTDFMAEMGNDPVATRGFLKRDMGLPTPEDANEEKARVFTTRYYEHGPDDLD